MGTIRHIMFALGIFVVIAAMPVININQHGSEHSQQRVSLIGYTTAWAADEMKRLNLTLQKLNSALESMKKFDQLEKQGLPKRQVALMKTAMRAKIQQMINDAIDSINRL